MTETEEEIDNYYGSQDNEEELEKSGEKMFNPSPVKDVPAPTKPIVGEN